MQKRKIMWTKPNIHLLLILGIIGLILTMSFVYYKTVYAEMIYPKVFAGDLALGGQSLEKAFKNLKEHESQVLKSQIQIEFNGKKIETTFEDVGGKIEMETTLLQAFEAKRVGSFIDRTQYIFKPKNIDIAYSLDQEKFDNLINTSFTEVFATPKNAEFEFEKNVLTLKPDVIGKYLDKEYLKKSLQAFINTPTNPYTIKVSEIDSFANIRESDLKIWQADIESLLSQPHTLKFQSKSWKLKPEELLKWIRFEKTESGVEYTFDETLMKNFLGFIADDIKTSPRNAKVAFVKDTGEISITSTGIAGKELMINESIAAMKKSFLDGKFETELSVSVVEPTISEYSLSSLGITTLLGSGKSNYAGSSGSRQYNIKNAAEKVNGILVPPGEEFSFVKNLGAVNAATGYKPELVIKGDKTIPEYGGGVCQVSTTLFRAALNASLPILERHPHSYVVSYYGTPGLDATIYIPKPDFVFKNDTQNHILLQYYIQGTEITFEIFGSPNGRTSEIVGPSVLSSQPDGSMKTVVYRKRYQDGNLVGTDSFYSNYRAPNKINPTPYD
jgi:vancomycin resistance protein YoaR